MLYTKRDAKFVCLVVAANVANVNTDMKLDDIKPNDYTIHVDLDGVLADLETYIEQVYGPIERTADGGDWVNADEIFAALREKGEPRFDKLDKLPDADQLWGYVRKYAPNILSASGKPEKKNSAEKHKWVKEHFTGYGTIRTVVSSLEKAKYANPQAILIDDRMKSIGPWRKAGGIGILHTSAAETIKELEKLGL